MKKNVLILCCSHILYLISLVSVAQVKDGNHQKLFDLFAVGKYEDCAFKAEGMLMNDKYKKDPEPMLYLSMCFFKISKMDSLQLDDRYKEPLKESLKYAKKFKAKDKDGRMYNNNRGFFDSLKIATIESAIDLYNRNQYGKASAYLATLTAFDEDDNVRFAKGVYDILGKNTSEGAKSVKVALNSLITSHADTSFKSDIISKPLLAYTMIVYADYLDKNKMEDSAKKIISIARDLFPDDSEVSNQYNVLCGSPSEEKAGSEKTSE